MSRSVAAQSRSTSDARRGFPQGSAASPLATEILLTPCFEHLPEGGASTGYADNFLAVAKDENDAVSMTQTFRSALKAHPAGHFRPRQVRVSKPGRPIEFLGHRLDLTGDFVRIDPTEENLVKFKCNLRRDLQAMHKLSVVDPLRAKGRAQELCQYVCSWTSAFRLCADADNYRAEALERIKLAADQ